MKKDKYVKVKETSIEDEKYAKCADVFNYALDKTLKELKQSVEGLTHNLNSLQSRSGAQLPFSSINYGTCTLKEGQYIIDALLDGQLSGTGPDHRTSIFPCAIFQYNKELNGRPGTPNYSLFRKALYSCSKRIYPNFANTHWSVQEAGQKFDREQKNLALKRLFANDYMAYSSLIDWIKNNKTEADNMSIYVEENSNGTEVIKVKAWSEQLPFEIMSTMGCRTYNSYDINADADFFFKQFSYIAENGELPRWKMWSANQKDGRGNICPVTIILPTLAMESKLWSEEHDKTEAERVDYFMNMLEFKINQAREMLIERFTLICSQPESSARFMWNNNTMYGYDGESVSSALKHGTLAIGQIGVAESLQLLIGCDQTEQKGLDLAIKIEQLFNKKCAEFKKNDHLNFGVYYTPGQNKRAA